MSELYPELEHRRSDRLDVGDGHVLAIHEAGNPGVSARVAVAPATAATGVAVADGCGWPSSHAAAASAMSAAIASAIVPLPLIIVPCPVRLVGSHNGGDST